MSTNEFLPFGTGAGATVLPQSDYAALTARSTGFQIGVAEPAEVNKVWRQSAVIAALVGQFIVDIGGFDALDNGDVAALLTSFKRSLQSGKLVYAVAGGTANALTATLSPALAANTAGTVIRVKISTTNTAAATLDAGPGALPIQTMNGNAVQPADLLAGMIMTFVCSGTAWEMTSLAYSESIQAFPIAGCYLKLNTSTQLLLVPKNGGYVWIDGKNWPVPAGGVALNATGLTPSTFYYIYAYSNAGMLTLEASTTGYSLSAQGIPQKTGDVTRTLVGAAYTQAGPTFADTDGSRFVISWFNRVRKASLKQFSTTRSTTSTTLVEINSEIRTGFISWSEEFVNYSFTGDVASSSGASTYAGVGFDGVSPEPYGGAAFSGVVNGGSNLSFTGLKQGLSEGAPHYLTLLGAAGGGTATFPFNTGNPNLVNSASLQMTING